MASGNSREKLGRSVAALHFYAPNRHDTGSTTARSVCEVALIRDTISHYSDVLIAPFVNLTGGVTAQKFFFWTAGARGLSPLVMVWATIIRRTTAQFQWLPGVSE